MGTELSDYLNRPLVIGDRKIEKRLVLAPMSKLGTVAFRELLMEYGGFGMMFSEMCGSRAIPCGRGHEKSGFIWRDEELASLVCQIYGDEPNVMAKAAQRVEKEGFFGVDINFGCSVKSICNHNCGAALLKQPKLAYQIVSAIRKAVSIPVFVKFRTGWSDDPKGASDLAKLFEDAGADALTFHPRIAPDLRSRPPKWAYIGIVKDAVSIPVFGNGDVIDEQDCLKMLTTTGCDGVALGRIAITRPWIFAQWTENFTPDPDIYKKCALRHLKLLAKHFDTATVLRRFHKFSIFFASNFQFGHTYFKQICGTKTIKDVEDVIDRFFATDAKIVLRPNVCLFH